MKYNLMCIVLCLIFFIRNRSKIYKNWSLLYFAEFTTNLMRIYFYSIENFDLIMGYIVIG